jgi:class 3 adenylate cyclase
VSELLATLASYVAPPIVRRFASDPAPLTHATGAPLTAAVLFADISGFTALTERLAEQGPRGAEELTHLLNAFFGQLIDLIAAHGGQVAKFAGDALLALWSDDEPATLARRAAQCALAVQQRLAAFPAGGGHSLTLRIGVSTGELISAHLGGTFGR